MAIWVSFKTLNAAAVDLSLGAPSVQERNFLADLQSYEFRASTDNVNLEKFNQEKLSKMITDGTLEEVVEIKPGKVSLKLNWTELEWVP